jgi:hypothetical protein
MKNCINLPAKPKRMQRGKNNFSRANTNRAFPRFN